jgi:hypothetical protein
MKSRSSSWLFPARFLAIAPLALVALFACPTEARALGDYIGVEAAPWSQGLSGNAAIDTSSTQGTQIDFRGDLGLANRDITPAGRVWLRWGKSHLTFDYSNSTRTGDGTFNQNVTFNGTSYSSGETVASEYDLNLLSAQYRYSFLNLKVAEFGIGMGLNVAQIRMQVDGSSSGMTTFDENVPYPTVNAAFIVKPLPGLHIRAEADGLSVDVSGNRVSILDARIQVESYFAHAFGIFGGYRSYRFTVDANDFGHVENSFKGPYVGLGVKF